MDKTKREELEKAYKREKNLKVAAGMLAVHMVYVRGESVGETAADLMRTHKWVYGWLERYDARGLDGLWILPRSGRLTKIKRETIDQIMGRASRGKCMSKELRELVRAEIGVRLRITSIRRIMRGDGLTPTSRIKSTSTEPAERRSGTGSTALRSGFRAWKRRGLP